jgi:hypothetical protein
MTDHFADRPQETATSAVLTANTTYASLELGETSRMHGNTRDRTVWAEWIAPADGWVTIDTQGTAYSRAMIAVYTGSDINALSAVARAFAESGPTPATVRFPVAAGSAYQIVLDGNASYAHGVGRVNINLASVILPSIPSVTGADVFAERATLVGSRAIGVANTLKAERDAYEPDFPSSRGATVWWEWTAPATGRVTIDTLKSDFNTTLTVLAGIPETDIPFAGLDPVSANDDVPNAKTSRVDFQTQAGRTYQILVDGWGSNNSSVGNVVLNLELSNNTLPGAVPGGNDFSRRGILTGLNAAGVANSAAFSTEAFEFIPSGSKNTARWEWTAPESCTVIIDTLGSDFDTVLHLYSGSELEFLVPLASNDDATGTNASKLVFEATKGTSYQFMVNGRISGRGGNIILNLNRVAAPEITVQQPVGSNLTDGRGKRSFGTVKTGSKGALKTFTIRNTGTATLSGLAIRMTGAHAGDFIAGSLKASSLAPGASTTFAVRFAPRTKGIRTAAIQIKSNDADENPFDIIVTGFGTGR